MSVSSSVTFSIGDTDEIKELLEKYKDDIAKEFLDDWADAVLFEAKRLLREGSIPGSKDPHGGGAFDRGKLYKESLVVRTKDNEREVRFTAPHAVFIEYGTVPHMPPVKPLQKWARRNKIKNWKSVGWAIAKSIAKYGTPPKPFLRTASFTIEKKLQEIWDNVIKQYD